MKKLFLTALLAAQGLFATQGKAQIEIDENRGDLQHEVDAGKISMVFETISYRVGDRHNSSTPGIGLEYRLRDHFHLSGGFFANTYSQKFCAYALAGFETNGEKAVGIGTEIGVATGTHVPLVVVPYVRFGARDGRLNLKLNAIPPGPGTPLTFGCQLRWKLGA
jgi:hypothetical protein